MRKAEYCAQKEGIKQKTGEPDMAAGELIKGRFQKDKKEPVIAKNVGITGFVGRLRRDLNPRPRA